jgi:NADPH-dependent 2,4-dienoyl-CoA reductase/sulfur reductase-like enzyme
MSCGDGNFAAGDIASFVDPRTGEPTRIEHWRTALQQGRAAAKNMLDRKKRYNAVPFFWTTQFDVTLNYVGHATGWDRIEYQGDVEKKDFLALYIKDEKVTAVAGMNRDRDLDEWEEKFRLEIELAAGQCETAKKTP